MDDSKKNGQSSDNHVQNHRRSVANYIIVTVLVLFGVVCVVASVAIVISFFVPADYDIIHGASSDDVPYSTNTTTQSNVISTTTTRSRVLSDYLQIISCTTEKPNSVGSVDLKIVSKNVSGKTIKYITYRVVPYNAVDDPVLCEIRTTSDFYGKITGPIEPDNILGEDERWSRAWYNSTIVRAEIKSVEIIFMDGETVICLV